MHTKLSLCLQGIACMQSAVFVICIHGEALAQFGSGEESSCCVQCKGGELHMGVFQLREEGVDLTTNGDSYVNVVALSPAGAHTLSLTLSPRRVHKRTHALYIRYARGL